MEDDVVTMATTGDCSLDLEPQRRRRRRRCTPEQRRILFRMPSFWFFIMSCILLLLSITALPILKYYQSSSYPTTPKINNPFPSRSPSTSSPTMGSPPSSFTLPPMLAELENTAKPDIPTDEIERYIIQKKYSTAASFAPNKPTPQQLAALDMRNLPLPTTSSDEEAWRERYAIFVLYHSLENLPLFSRVPNGPSFHVCEWHSTKGDLYENLYGIWCNEDSTVRSIRFCK